MATQGGQYGIFLNFDSNGVAEMKKLQAEMKAMQAQQKATTATVEETNKEMGESFKELKATIIEAFAVREIFEFGKELLHVTAEFQSFDNVIKYSSLNTIDAQENLSFLKNTVTELKLPMKETYESFSELQAGMIGTGIEGKKLRDLFHGIAVAQDVLHMKPMQFQRTMYAMKEIGEVGLNGRYIRELRGSLAGVNEIVKEQFGKTFEELKGNISGADFLQGLGKGLEKHFTPGLGNALKSLQSEMNATEKSMTQGMLDMGKNLEPVFIEIMHSIQGAFNSAPVQYFVKNIKEIVQLVGFAAEAFVIYKGIMLSATIVTWGYEAALKAVEIVEYAATFGAEGFTVAIEGLEGAFAGLGIGAIALGIAALVNQFAAMNKQIDDTVEGITHVNSLQQKGKQINDAYGEDVLNFKEFKSGKLDDAQASAAYEKLQQDLKSAKKEVSDRQQELEESRAKYAKMDKGIEMRDTYGNITKSPKAQAYEKTGNTIEFLGRELGRKQLQLNDMMYGAEYFKASHVKPGNYQDLGNGVNGNAANSSDLSGAKGGLSEAKVINIHIDNVQRIDKVEAGSDWKRQSQSAGEQIMREINNLSLSQSSSF